MDVDRILRVRTTPLGLKYFADEKDISGEFENAPSTQSSRRREFCDWSLHSALEASFLTFVALDDEGKTTSVPR
jgi:hypothetical protein